MRVTHRFQEKYRHMREDLVRMHSEKLEKFQKLKEEQRCFNTQKVLQYNFSRNSLVHSSILFAIYADGTHCISINVAQVACSFDSCSAPLSPFSPLSFPFSLSPFLLSPLPETKNKNCHSLEWQDHLISFLSYLVEINASDALAMWDCY